MPITLSSNIASLTAQRRLAEATSGLSRTFERLSSGQRINRARDDAAGLAIADSLNADTRIFNQGVRNLNDGISLFNIADAAIENLTSIVARLEELATQAANGIYGVQQRKALDAEAQALSKEYFRIVQVTDFNGQQLLSGSLKQVNLQAGYGSSSVLSGGVGGNVGTGSFASAVSYNVGSASSHSVALGDLDGDGNIDIVNSGFGYAAVRLGTGSGGFSADVSYAMDEIASYAVKLGDLNNDGILDLVTAGRTNTAGQSTVRLGLGNGTFGAATSYTGEGSLSNTLALGDVNGDGNVDMVTVGQSPGYAAIRFGTGTGTFGTSTSVATEPSATFGISLTDLNADGILDLVTAGSNAVTGQLSIRLGNGNGTFASSVTYESEVGVNSRGVAVGDLNGDDIPDVVTAGINGYATVRLGIGNGTFGTAVSYAMEGNSCLAVTLGDINGDGVLDLATSGNGAVGTATVRLGTGS